MLLFLTTLLATSEYIVMFKRPPAIRAKAMYANYMAKQQVLFQADDRVVNKFGYGYVACLGKETEERIKKEPYVEVVEQDQKVKVLAEKYGNVFDDANLRNKKFEDEKLDHEALKNKEVGLKTKRVVHGNKKLDHEALKNEEVGLKTKRVVHGNKKLDHEALKTEILKNEKLMNTSKKEKMALKTQKLNLENQVVLGNKKKKNNLMGEKKINTNINFDDLKRKFETFAERFAMSNLKPRRNFKNKGKYKTTVLKMRFNTRRIDESLRNYEAFRTEKNKKFPKMENNNQLPKLENNYELIEISNKHSPRMEMFQKFQQLGRKNSIFRESLSTPTFFRGHEHLIGEKISSQNDATWGLKRISASNSYVFPNSAGSGAVVFVLDTGIDITHREFSGRAIWGINLVPGSPNTDENGHGTHCAGIIAGMRVGVAKKAKVVAVKVLDVNGEGMVSRLVLGIDYIIRAYNKLAEESEEESRRKQLRNNPGFSKWNSLFSEGMAMLDRLEGNPVFHEKENSVADSPSEFIDFFNDQEEKPNETSGFLDVLGEYLSKPVKKPKFIVNMSVGGVKSRALDFAVEYASNLGIHFVAAAGNDNEDACDFSPSSSRVVITTGASTKSDKIAFFSNYGSCVDIFAPGVEIVSSWIGNAYRSAEGTSMASPHVAGVAALYVAEKDYRPEELKKQLLRDSAYVIEDQEEKLFSLFSFYHRRSLVEKNEFLKLPLLSTKNLVARIAEEA